MPKFVKGTCEQMCPQPEIKLRTKEHLLHFFETKPGEKHTPEKLVKQFSRSAAGVKSPRQSDLRTPAALQRTIEYLLENILSDQRKSYPFIYDFIFDRLRSVRQEIVMQHFNEMTTIKLLQPIILFLAYSSYRLCEETISKYDPKICSQHLQECLKKVLCSYDEIGEENLNRNFIEALYQVFNLGSLEALRRGMTLPENVKSETFNLACKASLEYANGNYYKCLKSINKLPHLLSAVASLHVQFIRQKILHVFSYAYHSKQLTVPVEWLRSLMLYDSCDNLKEDCKYYNVTILSDKNAVQFYKQNFDVSKPPKNSTRQRFVEDKLRQIYLVDVLLLKKL